MSENEVNLTNGSANGNEGGGNEKAAKFDEFLAARNIPWFERQEHDDEFKTVVYRGNLDTASQRLPIFVVLDASIFAIIRLIVAAGKVADENRPGLERFLSDLNSRFKIFKYYVNDEDGAIYMDISVPSLPANFDPELIVYLIGQILLPHMEEFYPKIMERAWGKQEDRGDE